MRRKFILSLGIAISSAHAQPLPIVPVQANTDPLAASLKARDDAKDTRQASPLPITRNWTLQAGKTVGEGLKAWAATANWTVIWTMQKDWIVPADTTFSGEFPDAAEAAIKTLAANGALIRAAINDGNRTLVVFGPGGQQQ